MSPLTIIPPTATPTAKASPQVSHVQVMPHEEWHAEGKRRFGDDPRKWLFVCPMCHTPQSAEDFYRAGFTAGTGEVNKVLGFSCIGRWTGAPPYDPGSPAGRGCDWTLGGLFTIHRLEIIFPDGERQPCFEFAEASATQPQP